jgi:hypothetical protein
MWYLDFLIGGWSADFRVGMGEFVKMWAAWICFIVCMYMRNVTGRFDTREKQASD